MKQVQIDGLVVLKIIKHYQEEGQGTEVVQGVLLGLVVEDRLEITNCFPFPQHTEDDADFDEVQYQMEMMRSLRHVNIDHLHVGWYQSTYYGSRQNPNRKSWCSIPTPTSRRKRVCFSPHGTACTRG